jgi:hypothetical protein
VRDGARWQVESADSDACLRRMVAEGIAFQDVTITALALKDIIARITAEQRP